MFIKISYLHLLPFLALLSAAPSPAASAAMRAACESEIRKFSCDAKSESYAYDCLSKRKEDGSRTKGFSQPCYKAYASFEKSSGKDEKIESHQVERLEHTN